MTGLRFLFAEWIETDPPQSPLFHRGEGSAADRGVEVQSARNLEGLV